MIASKSDALAEVGRLAQENKRLENQLKNTLEVANAMLEWIDAVPSNVALPSMPGFDRDWCDNILNIKN
tara:strand:+ start:2915 stop:3121 length:207 start_codon:yes stop_codon:yes gene_type:complete